MSIINTRVHKKPNQDDGLIPLINIVFLMLIFFMVAGHIEATDAIKVKAPESISDSQQQLEPLEIIVSFNQQISVDNKLVTLAELPAVIETQFQSASSADAFSLLIKVDAGLPVEELQSVLRAIKTTGIKKVSLATQRIAEAS